MRILGAMAVRNGADLIEASVRHNLAALDGLVALVHGSSDGTLAILEALVAEGLPLTVVRDDDPVGDNAARPARLLREAFASGDPDWVIVLDAADFLKPPSHASLERALADANPSIPLALMRQTYVPDFGAPATDDLLAPLRSARRLASEPHPALRSAVPKAFAAEGAGAAVIPPASLPRIPVMTAQVPVRSPGQLVADCTVARLAALAAGAPEAEGSWVDAVYREVRAGRALTAAFVEAAAVNAGVPLANWVDPSTVARVDDPFLAPIELKHTPARAPFPLARVLALGEYLARNEAVRIQSQLLHGADAGAALGRAPPR